MRRIPLSRGISILPSLFTTGNLFFGFFSIVRSISGDFFNAALALGFAALFDMLDGRIARLTRSQSDFGSEYDSLVDLSSFGLAPAILLYVWDLKSFGRLGWLIAFLFFACGALRLARFNVQIGTVEKKRFQGLPIPAAALLLASIVLLYESGYGPSALKDSFCLAFPFLLGLLMVSRIRYRSFKDLEFRSRNGFYLLVGAVVLILILALNPEFMPFVVFFLYAVSGPIEEGVLAFKRKGGKRLSAVSRENSHGNV